MSILASAVELDAGIVNEIFIFYFHFNADSSRSLKPFSKPDQNAQKFKPYRMDAHFQSLIELGLQQRKSRAYTGFVYVRS